MKEFAIEAGKVAMQHTGQIEHKPYSAVVVLVIVLGAIGIAFALYIWNQNKKIDSKDLVIASNTQAFAEANLNLVQSLADIKTAIVKLDANQQAGNDKIIGALKDQERMFLILNKK